MCRLSGAGSVISERFFGHVKGVLTHVDPVGRFRCGEECLKIHDFQDIISKEGIIKKSVKIHVDVGFAAARAKAV